MIWRFVCMSMLWCVAWCGVMGVEMRQGHAQQVPDGVYVPKSLESWVPWIMAKHGERQCALIEGDYVCEWPGSMTLEVDDRQGVFTLDALIQQDGTQLVLPGGERHWPQDVRVDGVPAMVIEAEQDVPSLELKKGRVSITGRFEWKSAPEVLDLPGDVAMVELTLDGKRVPWPRIDDTGKLWVKEASAASVGEADTLRVSVYRHVQDDIPLAVTTLLELNVAGRAREVSLGRPLIAGGLPVSVSGALPTQIAGDGEVKVYVRPGTYQIEIASYFNAPLDDLIVPARAADFFDPVEYWVWTPNEVLRSVELEGMLTIDPSRTTLPERWRGKTTLSARSGDTLKLVTTRRGQPEQPPNQVHMDRTIWLDIDGEGYTIKDRLSGKFHQEWRLNYDSQYGQLGRVMDANTNEALLITKDLSRKKLQGVELRNAALNVEAEIRLEEARSELPAVGWAHDVQSLHATLMMPPGWSVLASQGVDEMSGTWVDSWDMFEFFVVLMIAFVMGKLFGWPWGVVSALALVLSHGQPDAPRYVWFHIVAVLALLRVLPHKLWLRIPAYIYLAISFVVLVSTFGYYAHQQIRGGLHPQVMPVYSSYNGSSFAGAPEISDRFVSLQREEERSVAMGEQGFMGDAPFMDGDVDISISSAISSRDGVKRPSGKKVSNNAYRWQQIQQQVDPKEVVQTGPGLPNWSWRTWDMKWNGPVARDHDVKLWLISPMLNLLARILGVLCFLLMGLVVLAPGIFAPRKKVNVDVHALLKKIMATSLLGASILGASSLLAPLPAHAQDSTQSDSGQVFSASSEVIQELERRLLTADGCQGACVSVPTMILTLSAEGDFVMEAEVHAQRQSGWMLPGPATIVGMDTVYVDGVETNELRRNAMGMVYVRVPTGRHIITMKGRLNAQNVLTLQLDPQARPHRVDARLSGWSVDGIDEFERPDNSLQLSRQATEKSSGQGADAGSKESTQELPPWYTVERTLLLGLPWQSRTVISRQDTTRPQLIKIPLLPGEAVITEGVRVEQGEALINFERGVKLVDYMSEITLPMVEGTATIPLTAPQDKPWSETWHVECSRIWRCAFDGLVPVGTVKNAVYIPSWKPWPGESLTIGVRKPRGAEGSAATVTKVDYRVSPGERRLKATLSMTMRASQGGWQRVSLPPEAELQEVKINEIVRSIRPESDGTVSLPVIPGEQRFVLEWIQPWERSVFESFPEIDLGSEAVNVTMTMELGANRWLLWTVGPTWGPAVLFWSHVVLLVVLALLLGRLRQLPLRTYQWLLLVLGMSQLPLVAVLPIVAWFAMLVWRKERPLENASLFVLFQMLLVFWTLITLSVIYAAVHFNLLMDVDMQVSGRGSSNTMLNWYVDRSASSLPSAGVLSVPLFVWRAAMFAWVLWIVSSLVKWLPWAWRCFSDGQLWKSLSIKQPGMATATATTQTEATPTAPPVQDAVETPIVEDTLFGVEEPPAQPEEPAQVEEDSSTDGDPKE